MKAMILAAGRGERMRPITDHTPKPLVKVHGLPLIEHHIIKLAQAGFTEIVINVSHLAEQMIAYLGDGSKWNVKIHYSVEQPEPLETAGGIIKALPLLSEPQSSDPHPCFLVINGDIFTDFDFTQLPTLSASTLAHLWLVNNPAHHREGDFYLRSGRVSCAEHNEGEQKLTFSGIGLYRVDFFAPYLTQKFAKLGQLIKEHAAHNVISASHYQQAWTDVGTVERLEQLNREFGVKN